jgi:hypothetical protein
MGSVLVIAMYGCIGLCVVGSRGDTKAAAEALQRRFITPARPTELQHRWRMKSKSQWQKSSPTSVGLPWIEMGGRDKAMV